MAESIEIQEEEEEEELGDEKTYGNVETTARQKRPRKKRSVRRPYRLVGMGLGLLCGVQALLNIGLRLFLYSEWTEEKNNLVHDLDRVQSRHDILTQQKDRCGLNLDRLQSRYDRLIEQDDVKRTLCESHGFILAGDVCYYLATVEVEWQTWEESRRYCRDKQSDLIIINSKEKQDFVKTVVGSQWIWLGLTDADEEGVWTWVDGTPLTTPTYWLPGEPNDTAGEEDCAVFHNGEWNDKSCFEPMRWLCERLY